MTLLMKELARGGIRISAISGAIPGGSFVARNPTSWRPEFPFPPDRD